MSLIKFLLLGLLAFILLVAGLIGYIAFRMAHPETGINVRQLSFIPPSATEFSYVKSAFYAQYYFKIPESDFNDWVKSMKFSNDGYEQRDGRYVQDPTRSPTIQLVIPGLDPALIDFRNGIYIARVKTTSGGYRVGYNRETSMALYDWASH